MDGLRGGQAQEKAVRRIGDPSRATIFVFSLLWRSKVQIPETAFYHDGNISDEESNGDGKRDHGMAPTLPDEESGPIVTSILFSSQSKGKNHHVGQVLRAKSGNTNHDAFLKRLEKRRMYSRHSNSDTFFAVVRLSTAHDGLVVSRSRLQGYLSGSIAGFEHARAMCVHRYILPHNDALFRVSLSRKYPIGAKNNDDDGDDEVEEVGRVGFGMTTHRYSLAYCIDGPVTDVPIKVSEKIGALIGVERRPAVIRHFHDHSLVHIFLICAATFTDTAATFIM